jgi:hypothetical protein
MSPNASRPRLPLRVILGYCFERDTLAHALKTSLIVGTILAVINHGEDLLSGHFAWRWLIPMLLTYLVPLCVAISGIVHGKQQHELPSSNVE